MGRIKKCLAFALGVITAFSFSACGNKGGKKNPQGGFAEMKYISESDNSYIIDNGEIRLEIGKTHGEFASLKNKAVGRELINKNEGLPFALEYGYDRKTVTISGESPTVAGGYSVYKDGDKEVLEIEYSDLVLDRSKAKTGIKAKVKYNVGAGDYFTYSCDFNLDEIAEGEKGQENGIYALKFMNGYLNAPGSDSRLTAPTWNGGQYWKAPHRNTVFKAISGATLGYPGEGQASLECGWLDYSGDKGGIGVGIIDKQELVTEFRIYGDEENRAMKLANVIFEPLQILGESVPLLKGENYSSDPVLVVAHGGDWHDTADAYRTEYYKAFTLEDGSKDFIHSGNMSKRIKNLDYISRAVAMIYLGSSTAFDKMYTDTEQLMKDINGEYERHAFWLTGQNTQGYAYDVPFMTPTYAPSGGDEGLKNLAAKLQQKGDSIYVYEHPFATDPARAEIAAVLDKVDPGQHTEYWDGVTHHSVCIDNDLMYNMWKDEILPPQIALGVNGWQFDQCPLQQTVCNLSGHNHSQKALSRLSSHAKGVSKLQKLVRSSVEDGYIVSESRNDILSRYCDMFQLCWHAPLIWDGYWEYGAAVYTHPDTVYQASTAGLFWDFDRETYVQQSLILQSALYGTTSCLSDGGDIFDKEEFVRFKKEMRTLEHSGYPFGFRDNLGLTVSDNWLDARVYVEGENVTVVYLSNYHIKDATVKVDLERLGFAGKGSVEFKVTQSSNKLGYKMFNVNNLSEFNK